MIRAIDREWQRYSEDPAAPLPQSLVMLMTKAHGAIFGRVGKATGMDLAQMLANPEAALVELDKKKSMVLKIIEQRRSQNESQSGVPAFLQVVR
jgi:hypothetical protein